MTAQTPGTERAHETHDRLLVARFALGDKLAPDEAGSVRALLATCTDCTRLVVEMQLVQHATATSRSPARPRDFRITSDQAQTLRPNAWQRLLARVSAPRVAVLRPLAGATLVIGIVLVGAGAVLPKDAQAPAAPESAPLAVEASQGLIDDTAGTQADAASLDPQARAMDVSARESPNVGGSEMLQAPNMMSAPDSPDPGESMLVYVAEESPAARDARDEVAMAGSTSQGDATAPALLILGIVLAAVSVLVLILGWLARRATDPLLR